MGHSGSVALLLELDLTWGAPVTLDSRALSPTGATVWQKKVKGQGQAEFSEFKHDLSLAARRANRDAFMNLQREINAATEFR